MTLEARRDALMAECKVHLETYRALAAQIVGSSTRPPVEESMEYHPLPVFLHWYGLDKNHIHFYGYEEPDIAPDSIRYCIELGGGPAISYVGATLPGDLRERLESGLPGALLHYRYERRQHEGTSDEAYRTCVDLAWHCFNATQRYYLRLADAVTIGNVLLDARERGTLGKPNQAREESLHSALLVLVVSALEVGLKDLFFASKGWWFEHCKGDKRQAKRLQHRLAKQLIRGRVRRWRFKRCVARKGWNPGSLRAAIDEFQLDHKLNFQDMKNKRGGKWAFSTFHGISLPDMAWGHPGDAWPRLLDMLMQRHLVVHAGKSHKVDHDEFKQDIEAARRFYGNALRRTIENAAIRKDIRL